MIASPGSKAHWQCRVGAAHGRELLFEKGWHLAAASASVWQDQHLSPVDHIGKSLWDYPFLRSARPALEGLGLFECRIRGLKLSIEMAYAGLASRRDMDLWPVIAEDNAVLVHVMAYSQPAAAQAMANRNRFKLLGFRILPFQDLDDFGRPD